MLVNFKLLYRETINGTGEAEGKYIKQSGGRGNYGHVKIKVHPMAAFNCSKKKLPINLRILKRSEGFEFVNNIKGGVIPQEYIPACEKD